MRWSLPPTSLPLQGLVSGLLSDRRKLNPLVVVVVVVVVVMVVVQT